MYRFAQIFGGVVAYGISTGVKKTGADIESWKIIFLTIGLLTVTVGFIFLFVMPVYLLPAQLVYDSIR